MTIVVYAILGLFPVYFNGDDVREKFTSQCCTHDNITLHDITYECRDVQLSFQNHNCCHGSCTNLTIYANDWKDRAKKELRFFYTYDSFWDGTNPITGLRSVPGFPIQPGKVYTELDFKYWPTPEVLFSGLLGSIIASVNIDIGYWWSGTWYEYSGSWENLLKFGENEVEAMMKETLFPALHTFVKSHRKPMKAHAHTEQDIVSLDDFIIYNPISGVHFHENDPYQHWSQIEEDGEKIGIRAFAEDMKHTWTWAIFKYPLENYELQVTLQYSERYPTIRPFWLGGFVPSFKGSANIEFATAAPDDWIVFGHVLNNPFSGYSLESAYASPEIWKLPDFQPFSLTDNFIDTENVYFPTEDGTVDGMSTWNQDMQLTDPIHIRLIHVQNLLNVYIQVGNNTELHVHKDRYIEHTNGHIAFKYEGSEVSFTNIKINRHT